MAVSSELERYRDIATLGTGGMGTVTLAEDRLLGREVALKRLNPGTDARSLPRLRREALIGASISHENLVSIYDVIAEPDGVVIVMEYVEGETLAQALERERRLPAPEVLRILTGVGAGLDAIHARDIVHRDVKPANVLLGSAGAVKLADLGIASVPDRTRITSAGAVLGSWRYMAPEQLEDAPSTPAIDIYALAAVAYEMLSGERARREPNPLALAHAIATQPPPDLRNPWPQAPAAAAELLSRGMARDPSERPSSAGELIRQLETALAPPRPVAVGGSGSASAAAPTPRPPVPVFLSPAERRGWPLLAALLGVIALAVAAIVLGSSGSEPKRHTASRTGGAVHRARPGRRPAAAPAPVPTTTAGSVSSSSSTTNAVASTPAATGVAATPPASAAGTPAASVRSFYTLAAAHHYQQAWALADPTFRNQLGGYDSFVAGQSGDRSITFDSLSSSSQSAANATVSLATTSVRTDGSHHCRGTADLVPGSSSGGWLLHLIHITCS